MFESLKEMISARRGVASMSKGVTGAIGTVVLILIIANIAPDAFASLFNMSTTNGTPVWFKTVSIVVVGAGFLFLIWRQVE